MTDEQIEEEVNNILDNYTENEILPSKVRSLLEEHFKVKYLIINYN